MSRFRRIDFDLYDRHKRLNISDFPKLQFRGQYREYAARFIYPFGVGTIEGNGVLSSISSNSNSIAQMTVRK